MWRRKKECREITEEDITRFMYEGWDTYVKEMSAKRATWLLYSLPQDIKQVYVRYIQIYEKSIKNATVIWMNLQKVEEVEECDRRIYAGICNVQEELIKDGIYIRTWGSLLETLVVERTQEQLEKFNNLVPCLCIEMYSGYVGYKILAKVEEIRQRDHKRLRRWCVDVGEREMQEKYSLPNVRAKRG